MDEYDTDGSGSDAEVCLDDGKQSTNTTNESTVEIKWSKEFKRRKMTRKDTVTLKKGLTKSSENISSFRDALDLFLTQETKEIIIKYTNQKGMTQNKDDWKDISIKELDTFLGIIIAMGVHDDTSTSIHNLWSNESFFSLPKYSKFMSRQRIFEILSCLRFDDSTTRKERQEKNRLAAISEVVNLIRDRCLENYNPGFNLTIDEKIIPFTGNCRFRVYMPNKPDKYGIKVWALTDSENYYVKNFDIYLGKIDKREVNQSQRVVLLLTECLGQGYNITMDNFFTSFSLANSLLNRNITLLGTLRHNKKGIPPELLNSRGKELFSSEFRFSENFTLVSYVTKKKKTVLVLSSGHQNKNISNEKNKFKPELILEYNETKHGVDSLDKMTKKYSCKRASRRWTMSLFYGLIDICLLNAYVLFKEVNSSDIPRRTLYLEVARSLIESGQEAMKVFNNQSQVKPRGRRCSSCLDKRPAKRTATEYCSMCSKPVCSDHFLKKITCNQCSNIQILYD